MGYVVIEDGTLAPVAVFLGFIPMLLTAFAYRELNRVIPDCGTTFTWVTKAFGPRTGWFSGWVLTLAGIIVLANLAQVAAQYTFLLIGADSLAENTFWVTLLGVVFIAVMAWVSYRGIQIAHWLQNVLVGHPVPRAGRPRGGSTYRSRRPEPARHCDPDRGVLVQSAGLLRRGRWRVRGADRGHAADGLHLLGLGHDPVFERGDTGTGQDPLTTVAAISYAGVGTEGIGLGNEDNAGDVFQAISEPVLGDWSWIVLVAVLVSAVASTQTTILPAARGTLAMGVYRAIPRQFSTTHPRFKTPTVSTLFIGGVAIVIYVLLSLLGENAYGDVLLAIGLQISFYYGITAFACVWYFRKDIAQGGKDLWLKGILPLLGGLILLFAFVKSAIDMWSPDYGYLGGWTIPGTSVEIGSVFLLGIGSIILGLPIMFLIARRQEQKPFFRGESLHHDTPVVAPE
jgi:amino acid transporter